MEILEFDTVIGFLPGDDDAERKLFFFLKKKKGTTLSYTKFYCRSSEHNNVLRFGRPWTLYLFFQLTVVLQLCI